MDIGIFKLKNRSESTNEFVFQIYEFKKRPTQSSINYEIPKSIAANQSIDIKATPNDNLKRR